MTNKQAIAIMEQQKNEFLDEYVDFCGVTEAYNMAIKALEQEPCEDVVPRASVEYICRKNTVSTILMSMSITRNS